MKMTEAETEYYHQDLKRLQTWFFVLGSFRVLVNPTTINPPIPNQPTTDYLLNDPPTHFSLTFRTTDPIIIFKRLANRKIFSSQNINRTGNIILVNFSFMNNICLHNFECQQKKTCFPKTNMENLMKSNF